MLPATLTVCREVAPSIFQVRLPLPFALNHVNCYLLDDGDGWTILDAGLNRPELVERWEAAWRELGIHRRDIHRIVLTHMHPDHFGLAGWLQQECDAPVFMSPIERDVAQFTWYDETTPARRTRFDDYLRSAGVAAEVATVVLKQQDYLRAMTRPLPAAIELIAPGGVLQMAGRSFTAIHAPGHADGQLLFYSAADRLLLCGDHVLQKITPNIGFWLNSHGDPLANYLGSLADVAGLEVALALPGHHGALTDWRGRIAELQVHHEQRLAAMYAAAAPGATSLEVSYAVFNYDRFSTHEIRFAVAETLAHLEHLANQGRLVRDDSGAVRLYRAA
jgi:glyoxylase-like metal-dependent hydrolase (beta-lactamase superfamily II)